MVRIFGIKIGEGEKEKDEPEDKSVCKHPVLQRKMKYNPEKNAMEMVCQKCGQVVPEDQ